MAIELRQFGGALAHLGVQCIALNLQVTCAGQLCGLQGGILAKEKDEPEQAEQCGDAHPLAPEFERPVHCGPLGGHATLFHCQQALCGMAHGFHLLAPNVGQQQAAPGFVRPGVEQAHGFACFRQFFNGTPGHFLHQRLQLGVAAVQRAQRVDGAADVGGNLAIRRQIFLAAREQVAALCRLGV